LLNTLDVADFSLDTRFTLRSDFARNLLDFLGEDGQLVNHVVDGIDERQHFSGDGDTGNLLGQVSAGDSGLGRIIISKNINEKGGG
jgi:hypothetical protein